MTVGSNCVSALVLMVSLSDVAVATEPAAQTVYVGTAADVIAIAEEAAARGDFAAAETAFQALLDDPSPLIRAEARFRLAKMLAAKGRTSQAAVLLRRVLDDHPSAAPVRLELAALLGKMGYEDLALRELRALQTTKLPLQLSRFVDRWSASLQASKPYGLHLELALAPDTNINRATGADTLGTIFGDFNFTEASKAQSGVGLAMRGAAHARFDLGRDFNVVARAAAESNLYRDRDFNEIRVEMALGPEFRLGKNRLSLEVGTGHQWYAMKPYQHALRLSGSVARPLDAVSQLRLDGTIRWVDNKLNNLQDGRGVSMRASYERALSQRLSLVASLSADRFQAQEKAYSTRSWAAGLTGYQAIGRMTFSAGAEVGWLNADERLSILPEIRKDRLTRFTLGAVMRQFTFAGFAPMTRLIVERNRSTVEFYDFRRTRTEFGLTRAF